MDTISQQAANLTKEWETDPRWADIKRNYTAEDVIRLRGSITEEHTLARRGANRLWELLQSEDAVRALGAITGNQAVRACRPSTCPAGRSRPTGTSPGTPTPTSPSTR